MAPSPGGKEPSSKQTSKTKNSILGIISPCPQPIPHTAITLASYLWDCHDFLKPQCMTHRPVNFFLWARTSAVLRQSESSLLITIPWSPFELKSRLSAAVMFLVKFY